jgi:hypothetical protein
MTSDERSRRWYSLLEKSRALLDAPAPAPRADDGEPDTLQKWAAGVSKPEEPAREILDNKKSDVQEIERPSAPPIDDWASMIDERIENAIEAEHAFMIEIVGNALGEMLRDQRKEAKDELASEVRKLWAVLTELQCTLASLVRIGVTGKAEVLDLPALPRARDLN